MVDVENFLMNVNKKVRQLARVKMQQKMDQAAEAVMSKADNYREFDDVTGNLYKSIGIGTFYKGALQSIHGAPGPEPTRPTLAAGERYNLDRYYRANWSFSPWIKKRPFVGKVGEGGQNGPRALEDTLLSNEDNAGGKNGLTWQMSLVAGVDYANYVQTVRGHDVLTRLRDYLIRYFKRI